MVVWPELCLPVGTGRNFPHLVPFSELENALGAAVALSGCFTACGLPDLAPSCCHITESMDVSLSELRELVIDREAWRAAIPGVTKSRT